MLLIGISHDTFFLHFFQNEGTTYKFTLWMIQKHVKTINQDQNRQRFSLFSIHLFIILLVNFIIYLPHVYHMPIELFWNFL